MMWLIYKGWKKSDNHNEWRKDNWVIRFLQNDVEIYEDNVENKVGKYFKGKIAEIDLGTILDEIDEQIM